MAGGLHPGPQSKSMIHPKNHLFPRMFKDLGYNSEPWIYNARLLTNHARKWGSRYALLGVAGGVAATFFCEWKYVLRHVPLINWPYKDEN